MFTWINSQCVRSDAGFEVESISRFASEYREGDHKVTVKKEGGFLTPDKPCLIIDKNSFARWDDDPPDTTLPQHKQDKMLANFTSAMEFQGIVVVVE